jgi:hypothetical protein
MEPLLLLARVAAKEYDKRMKRAQLIEEEFAKLHLSIKGADNRLYIRVASKKEDRELLLLDEMRGVQQNSIRNYLSKASDITIIFINERLTAELHHGF